MILSIFLLIVSILNIVSLVINGQARREFKRKTRELNENPPMMKCICGHTLLSSDDWSRNLHALCVLEANTFLEAETEKKALAEAERQKAIDSPKKGKYKVVVTQQVGHWPQSSSMHQAGWEFDTDIKKWFKYDWTVKDSSGWTLFSGSESDPDDAQYAAEAAVDAHRDGNRVVEY